MSDRTNMPNSEAAIRAIETAYDEAWQAGDVPAIVAMFAEDVTVLSPDGSFEEGREELTASLLGFYGGPGKGSRHVSQLRGVRFVTDSVAVVDGEATIYDMRDESGEPEPPFPHRFTDIFVLRDGAWKIAHVRAYVTLEE